MCTRPRIAAQCNAVMPSSPSKFSPAYGSAPACERSKKTRSQNRAVRSQEGPRTHREQHAHDLGVTEAARLVQRRDVEAGLLRVHVDDQAANVHRRASPKQPCGQVRVTLLSHHVQRRGAIVRAHVDPSETQSQQIEDHVLVAALASDMQRVGPDGVLRKKKNTNLLQTAAQMQSF